MAASLAATAFLALTSTAILDTVYGDSSSASAYGTKVVTARQKPIITPCRAPLPMSNLLPSCRSPNPSQQMPRERANVTTPRPLRTDLNDLDEPYVSRLICQKRLKPRILLPSRERAHKIQEQGSHDLPRRRRRYRRRQRPGEVDRTACRQDGTRWAPG